MFAPAPAQANGCITPAAGTAQDPYIIATPSNLNCLRGNAGNYWGHGYYFRQTADLDMTYYGPWVHGIGSDDTAFTGTYDGNGFTISNLTIDDSNADSMGLFGEIAGSTLKDITLANVVVSGRVQVGGLVGKVFSGTIERVSVNATVTGSGITGGLIGKVDALGPTTLSDVSITGSVVTRSLGTKVGGLIGQSETLNKTLTISNAQSSASLTASDEIGGLIGRYTQWGSEVVNVTDSYASGAITSQGVRRGGLLGCIFDENTAMACVNTFNSTFTVTDSYWDTQTTGQSTTAGGRGTGKTTAQMTSPDTFASWSISESAPGNTTWGICPALNSGYPFLQWSAAQQGSTCSTAPPPVPTPVPATPPTGVSAQPGDASASLAWSAPASSGSYAVSQYMVTSSPDARICLTSELSCTVTGLRNGTPYTFTVQALTGAGWSAPSEPSPVVVPVRPRSIVITGSRSGAMAVISGTATGMSGETLTVMVRIRGEQSFTERGTLTPDVRGAVTWRLRTGKTLHAYLTAGGIVSNRVVVPR